LLYFVIGPYGIVILCDISCYTSPYGSIRYGNRNGMEIGTIRKLGRIGNGGTNEIGWKLGY
jgi:hypothetical protein